MKNDVTTVRQNKITIKSDLKNDDPRLLQVKYSNYCTIYITNLLFHP